MQQSIKTRKDASKLFLIKKAPMVTDDVLQLGVALSMQLSHYKPHWKNPVIGSVVFCQLYLLSSIQVCTMCNLNLCLKHFALFHTSRTFFEGKEMIASLKKSRLSRGETIIIRTKKGRSINLFYVSILRLTEASWQDRNYEIVPVGDYGDVGGKMCDLHQKIPNLFSTLSFS